MDPELEGSSTFARPTCSASYAFLPGRDHSDLLIGVRRCFPAIGHVPAQMRELLNHVRVLGDTMPLQITHDYGTGSPTASPAMHINRILVGDGPINNIQNATQRPRGGYTTVLDWNVGVGSLNGLFLRNLTQNDPTGGNHFCILIDFAFVGQINKGPYSCCYESPKPPVCHFRLNFSRILACEKLTRQDPV